MISNGIKKFNLNKPTTIIPSEKEAIRYAIENAKTGSLIVICSDVVPDALSLVQKYKEEEAGKLYGFTKDDIPNQ